MMKKYICTLVTSALIFAAIPSYASQNSSLRSLSLKDAINMAIESSPELEICDANKQSLSKQLKDAAVSKKDSRNLPVYASQNFDLVYVKNGYYVNMYRAYLDLADDEKAKTEATISYDTTQKYFTYKNTLRLCEVSQRGVERAQENLDIINQKYALGMCTEMEVTNATIALEEAKSGLVSAKQNSELAFDLLKIQLGAQEGAEFTLTDNIEVSDFSANLEADTKNALSSRYDVKALKVASELAQQYFKASGALGFENPRYHTAYADKLKSEHNYTTGLKNIALAVKSAYYDTINAQNSAAIAKKKLDYKKNEYEVNKLRFEMGMITNNILTALSDELTATEISYENTLLTYKLAVENYNYQITIGL